MDRAVLWATVREITESDTIEHTYTYTPLCEYLMACATFMDI